MIWGGNSSDSWAWWIILLWSIDINKDAAPSNKDKIPWKWFAPTWARLRAQLSFVITWVSDDLWPTARSQPQTGEQDVCFNCWGAVLSFVCIIYFIFIYYLFIWGFFLYVRNLKCHGLWESCSLPIKLSSRFSSCLALLVSFFSLISDPCSIIMFTWSGANNLNFQFKNIF